MWPFKKKKIEPKKSTIIPLIEEKKLKRRNSKESKMTKSSRGTVDEADLQYIGFGENYLQRDFELAGIKNSKLWDCYWNNCWVRACVDKIIKEVAKYKLKVTVASHVEDEEDEELQERINKVRKLLSNPNDKIESYDSIRRKYLRDILIYDAGALEIVYSRTEGEKAKRKLDKNIKELRKLLDEKINDKFENKDTTDLDKRINRIRDEIKKLRQIIKQEESNDDTSREPRELYDLAGSRVKLNVDKHGNFKSDDEAYKLLDKNNKIVSSFGIKELIYFVANPVAGKVYGLSPIESIYNTVLADNEAEALNRRRLENDGMINGVLSITGLSEKKLKGTVMYWKAQARKKGVGLLISSSDNVKFTKISESYQEMQFLDYQKWTLQKIMTVYGMQPIVLGVVDSTTGKLNSKEQREQFKSDAVLPLLKLETYNLTDVLVRKGFGFDDVIITYEEPKENVDIDTMASITEKMAKLNGVIKVNEARRILGLPDLDEGGDELIYTRGNDGTNINVEHGDSTETITYLDQIREKVDELFNEPNEPVKDLTEEEKNRNQESKDKIKNEGVDTND